MPKPWLRLWDKVIDSQKAQGLPEKIFRAWINLLCVANRNEIRGSLPSVKECAFALRVKPDAVQHFIDELVKAGLIDRIGEAFVMHQWSEWQPDYDLSTDRAAKSRSKKRSATLQQHDGNVSLAGAHAGGRSETERETETEGEGEPDVAPPSIVLGSEYTDVGNLAMHMGGDISWGLWVSRQGYIGHPAAWIKHALEHTPTDKFKQEYIAGTLRGYKRDGGLPKSNGVAAKKPIVEGPVGEPEARARAEKALLRPRKDTQK